MTVGISVLCQISNTTPLERWRAVNDPVFATAFYLANRLNLPVTPLLFGVGEAPEYLYTLPFTTIHRLDSALPKVIDPYDLATIIASYIQRNEGRLVLSPADAPPFPLLSGAVASQMDWGFIASVTSVEVFHNREIYVVRPTIGGNLAQIVFAPMVLAISSSPHQLPGSIKDHTPLAPVEISAEDVGKDKLLILAKADMAPQPVPLKPKEQPPIHDASDAVAWLFEE